MLTDPAHRYYGELAELCFVEKPGDLERAIKRLRKAVKAGNRYAVVLFQREEGDG